MGCWQGRRYETGGRFWIARLLLLGTSVRQIAAALDRSASSISREIGRHGGRYGYMAEYAAEQAKARRWRGSRLERNAALRETFLKHLEQGWSPEVVGRFRLAGPSPIGVVNTASFMPRSDGTRTMAGASICLAANPGAG